MKHIVRVLTILVLLTGLVSACQQTTRPETMPHSPEIVLPSRSDETITATESDLLDALEDLKQSILNKIDSDIDSTAEAFVDVKAYWKSKRWADIFKAPLVIVEGVINTLSKARDFANVATQADAILDGASTMCEVISVVMMLQDAREAGEGLEYGLYGPTYISAIEEMLEAADATYVPPVDKNWRENYKKVIENHLWGTAEGQLLVIPRKSTTLNRRNVEVTTGALEVRTSINRSLNQLISDIETTELPADFPIDKVVAQLKSLKQQITKSRSWQTGDITYETYLWNGNEFVYQDVETRLGAVGSLYTFLGNVAGNLDKQLEVEMKVEMLKAAGAVGSGVLLWSGNYKIEGLAEHIKVAQKAFLLSEIAIEGSQMTFSVDAEKEFDMLPQEMVLSLPMELSNLWMIADDTDQYLRYLLGINIKPSVTDAATTIYCVSTALPPMIDGVISPREWPEAAFVKELSYHNRVTDEDETHLMAFYCTHDEQNLYIAVKITNDDFQEQTSVGTGELHVDILEIYFDGNNDGIVELNEDIKNFWWLRFGDWVYLGERWCNDDIENGVGKATHSNPTGIGDYFYEFEIPLNSGDPQDLTITPRSTVGIKVSFREMNKVGDGQWDFAGEDGWPLFVESSRFDGATYGKLILVD